jgi:hypothetical protein
MHKEILSVEQESLLPLLKQFKREFYLAGGTAIALYIGHRRSIDFDLFKNSRLNIKKILSKTKEFGLPVEIIRRTDDQITMIINNVKFTFLEYPFNIKASRSVGNAFRVPELSTLAAMKAYALGRRSKWKDYVDLYFLLRDSISLEQVSSIAHELFESSFSEKLFRAQLAYFDDIDFTEEVEFLIPPIEEKEIKSFLLKKATEIGL